MRRAFNAGQLFPIHVLARQDADAVAEWLIDRLSRLMLSLESARKSRAMAASIWSASGLHRMALIDPVANCPRPTKIGSMNFVKLGRLLHHLRVQRPSEIIAELDSLQSADKPHFGDMNNADIIRTQVTSVGDVDAEQFIKSTRGETIGDFRRLLDTALATPKDYRVESIRSGEGKQLAFVVTCQSGGIEHRIERLRIANHLDGTRLAGALVEHLAERPLGCAWSNAAVRRHPTVTVVDDPWLANGIALS